jgi:acyl dehydratase
MPQRVVEGIEELKGLVGQEVGISDWFTVTQTMIDAFADVTGDRQWIHLDVERAQKESPFGTTIAHGFLTLSLLTHLHTQAVQLRHDYRMTINYGLNRVRFTAPVPSGSRVRARSVLQSLEEVRGGIQLTWIITVEIEDKPRPALVAEWLGRLYRG